MKAPPRRKGNPSREVIDARIGYCLNESPSKKEGKCPYSGAAIALGLGLNESPSKKEGKSHLLDP